MAATLYLPLLLLMLGVIACLAAVTRKYLLNTVTLICGMWFVSVCLASLRLYGIRPYSERVYAIIAIGCAGVAVGGVFLRFLTQRVYGTTVNRLAADGNAAYSFNMRGVLCFQIFCSAYYFFMCVKSVQLLNSGRTFADLRTIHQGYAFTETTLSNFQQAIGNHVAKSFIFVMIPAALIILFTRQEVRYRKTTLLLTALDLCMYTLYTASRMILVVAMIDTLVLMTIHKARITKRALKIMKWVGIIVCATVLSVTAFRVADKNILGIWETVYAYCSAPVPLMSLWIEKIDASIRPMNGLALSNGLLNALDILLKRLKIDFASHRECSVFISGFETFIPIYGGHKINAFVSAFTYFYLDGRETGVFLLGGLMGMIGSYFEERALKRPDLLSLLTYILLLQATVKFLFKWEFASSSYVLAFVYLRLIFVRRGDLTLPRAKRIVIE